MNATKFSLTAKSPRFPKRALFAAASMAVGVAGSGPVHAATEGDFWKSEQRTISINFGNSAITKGSAGAVDVAYTGWNNVGTASMSSLIDNTGATAGSLSLTLKDTDVYNTNGPNQSAATTGNGQLLYKFIDTWNIPADGMFAVNNLGGFFVGSYDVYLYVATSDGAITTTARYHPFLINGTMYKGTNGGTTTTTNEADEWTPLRGSDSQALVEGNGGSYLKVTGLTDATLDVRSVRNDQSNGVNVVVGDVAGVQISGHVHVNADFRYWKGGTGAWGAAGTDWATVTGGAGSVAWGTGAGQVAVFDRVENATLTLGGVLDSAGVWVKAGDITLAGGGINLTDSAFVAVESGAHLRLAGTFDLNLGANGRIVLENGSNFYAAKNLSLAASRLSGGGTYHVGAGTTTLLSTDSSSAGIAQAFDIGAGGTLALTRARGDSPYTVGGSLSGTGTMSFGSGGAFTLAPSNIAPGLSISVGGAASLAFPAAATLDLATLTLGSGSTLKLPASAIEVSTLNATGTVHLNLSQLTQPGSYVLLENISTKNTAGVTWSISGLVRASYTVIDTANAVSINLTSIGQNLSLVWKGTTPAWDTTTTGNWVAQQGGAAEVFCDGDTVLFDATATGRNVTLSGELAPAAMTVDTSGGANYAFGGTGSIAGDNLLVTLQGGGTVTLGTANTYGSLGGGTLIKGGTTVIASNAGAFGAGAISIEGSGVINATAVGASLTNKILMTGGASLSLIMPNGDLTLANVLEGTGSISIAGTGRRIFPATASTFDGTLTVADAFTFNGANANWANVDVVSTASTSDRIFSGTGTMKFSSVTVGGTGKLLVNSGTNLDVAKITALENLTFEGGGNLTSSTGKVRFEVEQGKTVTWNNNKFVNSSTATLIKEGAGELKISNFQDAGIAKNIEVLGGTLNATNNSRVNEARNYLIKGTSPSDLATFIVSSGGNINGYFGNIEMNTGGAPNSTMTMEYGELRFANGFSHPLPITVTMRSSTIDFASTSLNGDTRWQMGTFKNLIVERPSDVTGTDVAVSYFKVTGVGNVDRSGIHLENTQGNAEFDIKEYAKLVVQARLIDAQSGTNAQGENSGNRSDLIKKGAGELELQWDNAFSGNVTVNGGTLSVPKLWMDNDDQAGPLGLSGTGRTITLNNNSVLEYTGSATDNAGFGKLRKQLGGDGTGTLRITNPAARIDAGVINAGLIKDGPGTLYIGGNSTAAMTAGNLTVAGGAVVLNGGFSSAGSVTVKNGAQILMGAANRFTNTNGTSVALEGTFDLNGHNTTVGAFNGTGGLVTNTGTAAKTGVSGNTVSANNDATLTIGKSNTSGNFGGNIQDDARKVLITKIGTGTQIFSGNNTYTGATAVNAGTLLNQGTISNSAITVASGATFGTASASTTGAVTVNSGGVFLSGGGTVNNLNLNNGGTLRLALNNLGTATVLTDVTALSTTGTVSLDVTDILSLLQTVGTKHVLNVTNHASGSVADFVVTGVSLPRGIPTVEVQGNQLVLNVTSGLGNLVWASPASGGNQDLWKAGDSTLTHWTGNYNHFENQDYVTFDDTAAWKKVLISGDVLPGGIIVDTDVGYEMGGSGDIKGSASLVKRGTGILTIGNDANAYTGGTLIADGGIVATHVNALGGASAVVTMRSNTTLSVPTGFASKIVLADNATVTVTLPAVDATLDSTIEGTGNVTVMGTGRRTFTGTAGFTGTLTVTDAFTFSGANANWANTDVVSTTATADCIFSGSGTMQFSTVTVGGAGRLLVNSGTNLDVAKISALDTLTFEGGGKLSSGTGALRFEVASGSTVTWNNNTFVNSASTKLVKEGEGTLTVTNFDSTDQSRNIEVLGGTLRVTTASTKSIARNYLIQGSSATDIATFTVALAADSSIGFFSQLQGDEAGGRDATMTMQYGKLYFESGVCHGLPNAITMRSSTIEFATGRSNNGLYQIASLPMTFVVERPSDMTTGVAVSYLKATHSSANVEGIHLTNRNGTTQFDIRENAKLVVEAILTGETGSPGSGGNLIKNGAGEMELTAANKYAGTTTINGGTLSISGNNNGTTQAYSVAAGATLRLAGEGTINAASAVTLGGGASLVFDRTTALTFANTLTGSGATLHKLGADEVHVSGTVSGFTGALIVEDGSLRFTNVPTVTRLELSSGATVNVGTNTLGLTGPGQVSFAGHSQSGGFSGSDIEGSLAISGGHHLRIGADGSADALRVSQNLALNNVTLHFEIQDGGSHDTLAIGGDLSVTSAKLLFETNGGIVLPGTYDIIRVGGAALTDADLAKFTCEGIITSESIRSNIVLADGGKTVRLLVEKTGVSYIWRGNPASDDWDTASSNWLKRDQGTDIGLTAFPLNGDAIFDGGGARDVRITGVLKPLEITLNAGAGHYTLANIGAGKLSGVSGIVVNDGASLTLASDGTANDFTGRMIILTGATVTLTGAAPLLADAGVASVAGAGALAESIYINGGSLVLDGSMGNATTTNRAFMMGQAGATLEVTGANAGTRATFNGTGSVVQYGAGARTLTLTGGGEGVLGLTLADGDGAAQLSVVKEGAGTWFLSGSNTFTGGVALREGVLAVGGGSALGATGTLLFDGGTLSNLSASGAGVTLTLANPVSVSATGGVIRAISGEKLAFDGTISGDGALVKREAGDLVIRGGNTFKGGLGVEAGHVEARNRSASGTGILTLAGGTFYDMYVGSVEVGALAGSGDVGNLSSTLVVLTILGTNAAEQTFSGTLTDGSATAALTHLTKTGSGAQVLSGANTYSGITNVTGGILRMGHASALGNSRTVNVFGSGTLDVGGHDLALAGRALTVEGGGASGGGALIDSVGGGRVVPFTLNSDITVRTMGTTTLEGVDSAASWALTLGALAGATDATFLIDDVGTGIGQMTVENATALKLVADESLSSSLSLTLNTGGRLLLASATQTFDVLGGSGSVDGTGTLRLQSGADAVFDGTLDGAVNLVVVQNAAVRLGNAASTTTGEIRIRGALALDVALGTGGASDVLGAHSSTVVIENGSLRVAAAGVSQTNRVLTLAGTSGAILSDGGALRLLNGNGIAFAAGVADYTLALGGSGGGESQLDALLSDTPGGALALVKSGGGTWALSRANTYTGGTFVENGTLALLADDAVAQGGTVRLGKGSASGVLELRGHAVTLGALTVDGVGASNRIVNNAAMAGSLSLSIGAGNVFTGALGVSGGAAALNNFSLTKTGAGTLTLSGVTAYTGDTLVAQGTLALGGAAQLAGAKTTVAPGAALDATGLSGGLLINAGQTLVAGSNGATADLRGVFNLAGGTLEVGSATASNILRIDGSLNVTAASTLDYILTSRPSNGSSILRVGALDLGAVTRISPELASGVLYIGSYTLFEYGTLSGDLSNLQIDTAHIDPRYQFEVRNDAANRRVTLAVSSISSGVALLWRGNLGTNWDGTHENFEKPPSSPASYFPGEAARFDNTAHSFDVDVGDGVFIGSLFFDNDATHTYTLRSAGGVDNRISGDGYLEKRGAGTLIIAMENDYDGALREDGSRAAATVLVEGTIVTAHDRALGLGGVLLYGGALKADADRALANAITIAEGATAGVDSNGHVFTLSGALASKATSTLLKTGAGVLALEGDGSAFLGELKVGQGVVRMGGVDLSGGVVNLSAASTGLEVLMAGGPARVGELRGVSGSVVSGSGLLEAGALGGEATFLGAIQGTLELRKTGAGVLVLAGDNSAHSGALVSALGRLQIGDGLSGTMNSGALSVLHDATLAVNLPTDWTLAQTVSGDGLFEKAGARTLTLNQANPGLSGGVLISGGLLELAGAGTLGTASVEAAGTLLFSKTGDYAFANDVTGTGVLIKAGDSGTATYLGAGRGVDVRSVELHSGVLAIGDGAQVLQQKFLAGTTLSDGTLLHLAPATGGGVTVGSLLAAGSGRVEKTGGGVATLIGQVRVGGGVDVVEGRLSVGDGSGREMLAVSGGVNVRHGAVFQVSRTGETRIEGALTGAGLLRFWGDANGAGTTVLLNAANAFTGDVELSRHAVLQIGDTGLPSQISGGAPVSINVEGNSVLRFTAVASGETGAALTIVGNGNVEYRGGGVLRHTSDSTAFQGTFRAAAGTFVFDAAQLGSHAAFDATGNGVLRIESVSAATTMLPANFGTGNGTVELGAADGTASARYGFGGTVRFGGTLSVGDRAMLSLSGNTIEAAILGVTQGGTLSGTGYVAGNLFNAVGGTLRPGGDLGSPGAFNVAGDFFNEGRVVVSLAAASATTVHYTGMAFLGTTGSLQVHMSAADYLRLRSGAVFPAVLVDDVPGADGAGILGGFAPQNITFVVREENGTDRTITGAEHNAFTYNSGTGLALFDGSIADIFGRRDGLDEFGRYLDATLRGGDAALRNVVVGLLGGGAGAVGAASPAGLASMTAMPIGIAHEDSANVFAHLQSLRYERGATNGRPVELQPYLTSAGSFARNGSATDSPAFNFNTYGGTVGFDQSLGTDVIAGFGAGYRHGRADLADAGGSVAQDNVRLNLYATWQVNDHVYVDAAMFAGYSSYGVRHQTVFGTGRASSNGIDIGGSLFGGGILSLSREFHLTPFAGIEYAHAKVDAFIETGSAAALRVGGFDQDSLRAKLGTGLNWQVPTGADFSLRLSLELAYAYELMDSKVAIRGRFAGDSSGNGFSAKVASLPEHSLQVGPAAEIGFDENTSLRLSYLLEHDLKEQVAHRVNATLRVRF